MPSSATIFGITLHFSRREEVQSAVEHASSNKPVRIATVNPEFLLEARQNPTFASALQSMTHCTVDGSGLLGVLQTKKPGTFELYHGADLVQDLFEAYADGSKSFYLLGGAEGLADQAVASLHKQYPNLRIVGAASGGTVAADRPKLAEEVLNAIRTANPDILLVGFGAPKQELLMTSDDLSWVPVMIGVGGTFGFYANKRRAPQLMRRLHLEWVFRTLTEPGHWRRAYRAAVVFPFYVFAGSLKSVLLRGKDRR